MAIVEQAIARWFAQGVTSHTHPVLRYALKTFLEPWGVEADALEAEPFSALEAGSGEWWLRNPRWNGGRFDRSGPAAKDFGYLLEAPQSFAVTVSSRGWLGITPVEPTDLATRAYLKASEDGRLAMRHSLQAAREVEAFLFGAVGLLLVDEFLAGLYASGDDQRFCETVRRGPSAVELK